MGNENQRKSAKINHHEFLFNLMITNCANISWVFMHSKHELTTALNENSEQLDFFFIYTRMKLERCDLSFNKRSWQHSFFITVCVHNCTNHDDGDYQSCNMCNGYVSCGGHVLSNKDCPSTLVWDSLKGRCEYNSSISEHFRIVLFYQLFIINVVFLRVDDLNNNEF